MKTKDNENRSLRNFWEWKEKEGKEKKQKIVFKKVGQPADISIKITKARRQKDTMFTF